MVTDGATFTDLQTRDTSYSVRPLDPTGMSCRVTTTADSGHYRIVTDYVTDPGRDALLLRIRFQPLVPGDLCLYLRFDPTVNGNGGGGSGTVDTSTGHPVPVAADPVTATNAANRDYARPVHVALDASTPFTEVSNGFAGTASDGLTQLDRDHALTATYAEAARSNLVQTARADLAAGNELTLALGFGTTQGEAVATAGAALGGGFGRALVRYAAGWVGYDAGLVPPPGRFPGLDAATARELARVYYLSANVLKASEDKTFPGAVVASLASPWGRRSRPATPTTPTSAPTARCSPATCTRPSPDCCWSATAPPPATRSSSCSSASSSPTARCPATAWSTASWRPTASASSSTRSPTRS